MSRSGIARTLLMRNVPLSLSRSRRGSTRRSQGRSPHPSTDSSSHADRRRSLPLLGPTMDDRCADLGGGSAMSFYSPLGAECTHCGSTFCDGCPLCCCEHPGHATAYPDCLDCAHRTVTR